MLFDSINGTPVDDIGHTSFDQFLPSGTVWIMSVGRIYLAIWLFIAASLLYYLTFHLHIHSLSTQKFKGVNLHPANMTVINLDQFEFLLNKDHCNFNATSPVSLLILVHSAPDNWMARQAIRNSWGRYLLLKLWTQSHISGLKFPERLLSLFFCLADQIVPANKWR